MPEEVDPAPAPATTPSSAPTKICMNPNCKKPFVPGHYGDRQLVCTGSYMEKCGKKCLKDRCFRCAGTGVYSNSCKNWYKGYWTQTRKPPRSIPDEDFNTLFQATNDLFWKAYLAVAREGGLRKGEMLGLAWGDVTDGVKIKTVIAIRGQWDEKEGFKATKTGQGRPGYLLEESRKILGELFKTVSPEPGWKEKRVWDVSESFVWDWFTRLQAKLGIKNPDSGRPYRVHDLRHTAAYRTYRATGNITKSQELLGHKNSNTTSIYSKERPEEFAAGLDAVFKKKAESQGEGGLK